MRQVRRKQHQVLGKLLELCHVGELVVPAATPGLCRVVRRHHHPLLQPCPPAAPTQPQMNCPGEKPVQLGMKRKAVGTWVTSGTHSPTSPRRARGARASWGGQGWSRQSLGL